MAYILVSTVKVFDVTFVNTPFFGALMMVQALKQLLQGVSKTILLGGTTFCAAELNISSPFEFEYFDDH